MRFQGAIMNFIGPILNLIGAGYYTQCISEIYTCDFPFISPFAYSTCTWLIKPMVKGWFYFFIYFYYFVISRIFTETEFQVELHKMKMPFYFQFYSKHFILIQIMDIFWVFELIKLYLILII